MKSLLIRHSSAYVGQCKKMKLHWIALHQLLRNSLNSWQRVSRYLTTKLDTMWVKRCKDNWLSSKIAHIIMSNRWLLFILPDRNSYINTYGRMAMCENIVFENQSTECWTITLKKIVSFWSSCGSFKYACIKKVYTHILT